MLLLLLLLLLVVLAVLMGDWNSLQYSRKEGHLLDHAPQSRDAESAGKRRFDDRKKGQQATLELRAFECGQAAPVEAGALSLANRGASSWLLPTCATCAHAHKGVTRLQIYNQQSLSPAVGQIRQIVPW
jgi:hypothetical protein